QYRNEHLGGKNGITMFQRLTDEVKNYNNLGKVIQYFKITNLMDCVHKIIQQSGEICYVDALASFELLNTSITLFYASCIVGALSLSLLVTSNELELTLKKGMNLLKTLFPQYAFFGRGPNIGPMTFLTDNSAGECNTLEYCWPQAGHLLCVFHVLQAFWCWLHNSKHCIDKNHKMLIMKTMRKMLYAQTEIKMIKYYDELKANYYHIYPQLQKHFELL
ncbi:26358_t:CDS:2, partial [Gigaspora margarita]